MDPAPLVTRDELVGISFVIDMGENVKKIAEFFEKDDDGEAEEDTA